MFSINLIKAQLCDKTIEIIDNGYLLFLRINIGLYCQNIGSKVVDHVKVALYSERPVFVHALTNLRGRIFDMKCLFGQIVAQGVGSLSIILGIV